MSPPVQRLYPPPCTPLALEGLYLAEPLRGGPRRPFVYTNFIASLDGRVAQPDPVTRRKQVPPAIANPRDWRLYQELAAQADVLLTTARHLRAVAAERHTDLLALDADLIEWRRRQGLPDKPRIAAASEHLDIPVEGLAPHYAQRLVVLTSQRAGAEAVRRLEAADVEVVRAGAGPGLRGPELVEPLAARGLCSIYSIAGPRMHHTLVADGVLDRLYLTVAHRMLGGEEGDTLLRGEALSPPAGFRLCSLYHDGEALDGAGQLFGCFDRCD